MRKLWKPALAAVMILVLNVLITIVPVRANKEAVQEFTLTTSEGASKVSVPEDGLVWLTLSDSRPAAKENSEKTQEQAGDEKIVLDLPKTIQYTKPADDGTEGIISYLEETNQLTFDFSNTEKRTVEFQLNISQAAAGTQLAARKITGENETTSTALEIGSKKVQDNPIDLTSQLPSVTAKVPTVLNSLTPRAEAAAAASGEVDISTYDPASVRNVASWEELIRALADTSVAAINITSGFAVPSNPRANLTSILTGGDTSNLTAYSQYVYMGVANIGRKVVIEGNDNTLDFGAIALCFYNTTGAWDFTWQNLNIYHGNIYGFTTLNDLSSDNQRKSKMTYHDITDVGSQLIHSPYTDVYVSGNTSTNQSLYYTSPYRTNWESDDDMQINLMITNLTLMENANFEMSSLRAGNILLRSGGSLILDKNSKMVVKAAQNNQTGEGDAAQTNLRIEGGSVTLNEGAQMELTPKPNYSAMALTASGSKVSIGENATIKINSTGHTDNSNGDNRNIVYLAAGANLTVAPGGELDVQATGMGSSSSNLIHVAGEAQFYVQKKGSFNAVSDSTSLSHNILYFASSSSKFEFKDAQMVNLQRTAPLASGSTNGLINIAGSSGLLVVDIQKVSMWNRGNFSETPDNSWTPMYFMNIVYNSVTPTVRDASSLTQDYIADFKSKFTTKDVQRVLFEYIPDVSVSIDSTATDVVTSADSTTVYGTTNPGAYVRISDVAVGSASAAIDPADNAVTSPVTAPSPEHPEFVANFTVQADAAGHYSYTLPAGKHFTAGSTISVYSFLNGKDDTATQIVRDATPPAGEPNEYHIVAGDSVPNANVFVKNPTDTNPLPQNFTYEYAPETAAVIDTLVNQQGTHDVKVILKDEAGNATTITAQLVVHQTVNSIEADDFDTTLAELNGLTPDQLKAFVLQNSNASATKLVDGVFADLTDKIQVTLPNGFGTTAGSFAVLLTVKAADSGLAADMTKTITVNVEGLDVTLTIDSKATDLQTDASSTTIYGKTLPGASVEIWDVAAASASRGPVLGTPATVTADANGDYTYTLPAGSFFNAESILHVKASKDGKSQELTQVVLDKTAPSGTGRTIHVANNTTAPAASEFVAEPTDSNPLPQTFVTTFSADNPQSQIDSWMSQVGEHQLNVLLADNAGNQTTIAAKLVVHEADQAITADDFTRLASAIEGMTDSQLKEYIVTQSNADAYKIVDRTFTDLTDKIQVTDLGGLSSTSGAGEFDVVLTVKAADSGLTEDLMTTIKVTITSEGPTAPVDPENPIPDSTPPNGAENGGTGNTGSLRLDYVPSKFNFGTVKASVSDQTYQAQKAKNTANADLVKQWIQVSDDRSATNGWSLSVQQLDDFKAGSDTLAGAVVTLPKGEIYNTKSGAVPVTDGNLSTSDLSLSTTAKTVLSAKNMADVGKKISTKVWNPEAVTIRVLGGTAKANKTYTTTVNWTLSSVPGS